MLPEPRGGRCSAASATGTVTGTAHGKVPGARGHGPMLLLTPRAAQRAQNPAQGEKKRAKHGEAGTTGEPEMGRGAARTHRHGTGGQNSLPDLPQGDLGCLQLSRVWDYGSKNLNSHQNRGPQSPAHTATRPQNGVLAHPRAGGAPRAPGAGHPAFWEAEACLISSSQPEAGQEVLLQVGHPGAEQSNLSSHSSAKRGRRSPGLSLNTP